MLSCTQAETWTRGPGCPDVCWESGTDPGLPEPHRRVSVRRCAPSLPPSPAFAAILWADVPEDMPSLWGALCLLTRIETPCGRQPELSVNSQASGRGLLFPVQVLWALEQDHISVQRRLWRPHNDTPFPFQRCGPQCSSGDGGRPAPSGSAHPGYSGRAQPGKPPACPQDCVSSFFRK